MARRYFKPFVPYFKECKAVLDVASGQGHFLELLKEAGIPATGIELDPELCQLSKDKGLHAVNASLFDFLTKAEPGSFDGAFASHIVEHFTPQQVEELCKLLWKAAKPDSTLIIVTPNIANIRRAIGDFWRDPTHVRPYPVPALTKILKRSAWDVVASDEYTDRKPSLGRSIIYGIRNLLLGRYWVGDDLYVVAKRLPQSPEPGT